MNSATSLKSTAEKALSSVFSEYDAEKAQMYFKQDYIQHNPHVPTGLEPILGFIPALKEAGTTYKTHRILQDGNFIIMHNTYDNAQAFGAKEIVAFDVMRIEDGKVAEHWDSIQPIVSETASGRTQFDGAVEITDLDQTEANKTLVKHFVNDVLFGNNPSKITDYISADTYFQHNPMVKDGLDGLNDAIQHLIATDNMFIFKKTHAIFGEGNFVLAINEGEWNGKPQAFYDLFRIERGKIVEHWDVIQEIPAKQAHNNGMFGGLNP